MEGAAKLLLNFGIQHFVCPEMFEGHMNFALRILRLRCLDIYKSPPTKQEVMWLGNRNALLRHASACILCI